MSIRIEDSLRVHAQALELRMQRSELLSSNLANESTPGFRARDFDFAEQMRQGAEYRLPGLEDQARRLKYRLPFNPSLDGNSVEQGVEQAEFSRNAMDFQTSLTFLTMKFRGLKQAIEGR